MMKQRLPTGDAVRSRNAPVTAGRKRNEIHTLTSQVDLSGRRSWQLSVSASAETERGRDESPGKDPAGWRGTELLPLALTIPELLVEDRREAAETGSVHD
jgi:hypothetical protein